MPKTSGSMPNTIQYDICIAIRAPILPGDYKVGSYNVNISYPEAVWCAGHMIELPRNMSTLFRVSWIDERGSVTKKLSATHSAERFHPLTQALNHINQLLLAFKFVRIGHADGKGVRTIGEADTLFYWCSLNGNQTSDFNMSLKFGAMDAIDPNGTTPMATPHINATSNALGRRYVRCFELLEHGYFTEALIISFAILDDTVQVMLRSLLGAKGIDKKAQDDILRGIKEDRLRRFLGVVLKLVAGKSIDDLWPDAGDALTWLNGERNQAMHGGYQASRRTAALSIYASMKTLIVLWRNQLVEIELPVEMFREAKLQAAWEEQPPKWVPQGPAAESFSFD